jgi:hypothetical protein
MRSVIPRPMRSLPSCTLVASVDGSFCPSEAAIEREAAVQSKWGRKLNRDEVLSVARELLGERKLDHLPFVRYTNRKRNARRSSRRARPEGRETR